jgi:hypothetical protein
MAQLNSLALEPFRGHLVDVGIGVACMQHHLQRLHGVPIQGTKIAHLTIKLGMRIADVQLGKFWGLAKLRK